jgi:hypothetical protein
MLDLLRAKGVISYEGPVPLGDAIDMPHGKMLFGPPVAGPGVAKAKPGDKDPRAGKRAHYENLLGRANIPDAELDLLP